MDEYIIEDSEAAIQFKEELEKHLYNRGFQAKHAASQLNITKERLYKYLNPMAGNNNFPAYLLPLYTKVIGDQMLRYIAHESGFTLTRLPRRNIQFTDALQLAARTMKECSDVITSFSNSMLDGKISENEFKDIKREVREAQEALVALQLAAEQIKKQY